jgi:uncharacterized damage-inducible protein DinB
MQNDAVTQAFVAFAIKRMEMSERDILLCVEKLSEEQMWARGGDWENSVGNLLLHLEGNVRHWILHGVGGQPDVREREEEFSLTAASPKKEIVARFEMALAEARAVIVGLSAERLLETIDPQPNGTWRHPTVLEAVGQVSGHLQQHMGQIVMRTKQLVQGDLDLTMPRKR